MASSARNWVTRPAADPGMILSRLTVPSRPVTQNAARDSPTLVGASVARSRPASCRRICSSTPGARQSSPVTTTVCPQHPGVVIWSWQRSEKGAYLMTGTTRSAPVLITGCSSGIGRAAAISLHDAGLTVYATARRVDSMAGLASRGIHTLALDVTNEASMIEAVTAVEAAAGAVAVLVNNAGYGLYGPVEQLPMDEIRRQFETNFFGLVRLTQLVLPGMRKRGKGRILNVSSMGGRITLPGGAFYHASKYAVEALSDALRMEVAQFGIDVVLIEPGPVKTPWNDIAAASLSSAAP